MNPIRDFPDHFYQAILCADKSTVCPIQSINPYKIIGWFLSFFVKPTQVSGIFADKESRKNPIPSC
jgi:hypothetical protein